MAKAKSKKTVYRCSECGENFIAWMGQCPACKAWNTFEETTQGEVEKTAHRENLNFFSITKGFKDELIRIPTGIREMDNVLGGGLVRGSVVLLGGEPGIGKSTLLLAFGKSGKKVLYVSGEEGAGQILDRANRTGALYENVTLLQETKIERILSAIHEVKPEILLVDSIQTVNSENEKYINGSVTQIRTSAAAFVELARSNNIPVVLTGHITKDGQIAGPKVLEHAVDVVLYFENQNFGQYRFIRSVKNRYGSTGEIAVFEMTREGLLEVPREKSLIHLDDTGGVGSILFPQVDGTRIMPVEVQVLATPASFSNGRRIGENIDISRIHMIAAILEKFLGYQMSQSDIFVRIHGGTFLKDSAGDLALLLAMASSYRNKQIPKKWAAAGELSLTGKMRLPTHFRERRKALTSLKVNQQIWAGDSNNLEIQTTSDEKFFSDVKLCVSEIIGD